MMIFESGVSNYVTASVKILIRFPVDLKGKQYLSCNFCKLYHNKKCCITSEIVPFPETKVGFDCPLIFEGMEYDEED